MKQPKIGDFLTFNEVRELIDDGNIDVAELLYDDGVKQTSNNVGTICNDTLIYETVYRVDVNHAWQYMGRCEKGDDINRDPMIAKKVFIISQFASNEVGTQEENIEFAIRIAKLKFDNGQLPIVPHLYFPRFLDDSRDIERGWGIEAGHALMCECDAVEVWMIDNWLSDGMQADIDFAVNELGLNPTYHNITVKRQGGNDYVADKTEP